MKRTTVTRSVSAPPHVVFDVVAHIDRFSKAVPRIVSVEFLSEAREGVGTRFRETRRFANRDATTELEVTEYVEGERVRLVADSHGTVWDSLFTVEPDGTRTRLTLAMDARERNLLAKCMNYLVGPMVRKAIEGDMDAVKAYCESVS